MSRTADPVRVGVLAYRDCFAAEVYGLSDLLTIADTFRQRAGEPPMFQTTVIGCEPQVVAAGGFTLATQPLDGAIDLLVVPGFWLHDIGQLRGTLNQLTPEINLVAEAASGGLQLASVCVGAFLLGEAGLLEHRRATTAWPYASLLQARYPQTQVDAEAMVVSDGPVITTAAFSAVHDLALLVIRREGGDRLARQVTTLTEISPDLLTETPHL